MRFFSEGLIIFKGRGGEHEEMPVNSSSPAMGQVNPAGQVAQYGRHVHNFLTLSPCPGTHFASSARYSASPAISLVARSIDALPETKHLPTRALSPLCIHR